MKHIFLYGPPGCGKTTVGKTLAGNLDLPFVDLDAEIETSAGRTIAQIMEAEGEQAFRELETNCLQKAILGDMSVIALGGGALLREANRTCAESAGKVVLLETDPTALVERLRSDGGKRPLISGDMEGKLRRLLEVRDAHYKSFYMRVANIRAGPDEIAWKIQQRLGRYRLKAGSGNCDVIIEPGNLKNVGELLREKNIKGPVGVVTDSNVGPLYAGVLQDSLEKAAIESRVLTIPAGEENKTLQTVSSLWQGFLESGLDRSSVVIALGGGVTGDLTGFAASTYMRGIGWIGIPTSLLAMVDSSLGGKTGFDLPFGKNLIGTFHSPMVVLTDPDLLSTLPEVELHSGLGEVVKHGVIADEQLYDLCSNGYASVESNLEEIVQRAVAVKIHFIEVDPLEHGIRALLNFGHTLGHAVELVSGFHIRHGEAVAIGMVAEARLAERLSLATKGLAAGIAGALAGLGLPTQIPSELSRDAIINAMQLDKKKHAGKVRFALPVKIGQVKTGVEIEDLNMIFTEG